MDILLGRSPKSRKPNPSRVLWSLHWWMAALYLLLFVGGTFMANLTGPVSYRGSLYDFHKSLGVITMGLLTSRILYLLLKLQRHSPPKRPVPDWARIRDVALHSLLYGFMLVVPLTGWFFSNSFDKDVSLFFIPLPRLFPPNRPLADLGRNLHFWLSYTFLAMVAAHTLVQWKFLRAQMRRYGQGLRRLLSSGK
jgi:cytochrome b561